MASGSDQSNELSMFDSDDASIYLSPDSPQNILVLGLYTVKHLKSKAAVIIFISKFKYSFSVIIYQGSINAA